MIRPRIFRYVTIYGTVRFEKVPPAWTKFMRKNGAKQVTNSKGDIIWEVPGNQGEGMKKTLENRGAIVEDIPAPPR